MSAVLIRKALEVALNGMSPSLSTAWENARFTPPSPTTAYQRVTVLLAEPVSPEIGRSHMEHGFMQVDLCYPIAGNTGLDGAAPAEARAELIRSTFYRGAPFTASGITVTVSGTPEIRPGRVEEDRYVKLVRIPFHAHIRS